MNISVFGLGKLGLCTAVCFANAGIRVWGVDNNKEHIQKLQARQCPIEEPQLSELLQRAYDNLTFSSDYEEVINNTDITLIIVPTPSLTDGAFDNRYIIDVLHAISPSIKKKSQYHIIDVVSTVMPTSCERVFIPLVESLTGKKCPNEFGFVYNPEFIALGTVIRDFQNPDLILIGASDEASALKIKSIYEAMVQNTPKYKIMNLINAEITKIALNCYVTVKISFANALSRICEKIQGADVDIVTDALGADTRIGHKCLKGGLGFGGPCFPRDNLAMINLMKYIDVSASIPESTIKENQQVMDRLLQIVRQYLTVTDTITILGLAYKANTHIIEASQAYMFAQQIMNEGFKVKVTDPKVNKGQIDKRMDFYEDLYDACKGSHAIFVMLDCPDYRQIDWDKVRDLVAPTCLLVDVWRIVPKDFSQHLSYIVFGKDI